MQPLFFWLCMVLYVGHCCVHSLDSWWAACLQFNWVSREVSWGLCLRAERCLSCFAWKCSGIRQCVNNLNLLALC
jgi:hypothetical protein